MPVIRFRCDDDVARDLEAYCAAYGSRKRYVIQEAIRWFLVREFRERPSLRVRFEAAKKEILERRRREAGENVASFPLSQGPCTKCDEHCFRCPNCGHHEPDEENHDD